MKRKNITALENILTNICALPVLESTKEDNEISASKIQTSDIDETEQDNIECHAEESDINGYIFERKLTGGFIVEIDSFVP